MVISDKLGQAFRLFDLANSADPNSEDYQGESYPKEVLYAMRMTEKLKAFAPNASESLQLAARCQHICRWEISRDAYEMNRTGYLKWRQALKKFHAQKASEILTEVGYSENLIREVCILLEKKQMKKNPDSQTLEDVICLVFLQYYFDPFAQKHEENKTIDILQKTWRKMSEQGQEAALSLPLSQEAIHLIKKAELT
ncbi:DUF4202 domain-containing protein [Muriicola sp. Z0-33]|uniref:DUF4202 domain-containing protein n=1 Tax=Muriicola sp. Z0-33 TaxID=2816957 RepID=UPI0022379319|nr:DUF4202 domain-containing protein [Muriicola sp. Z0-33]MCW5515682.1 DUF4202 domain-containing protein [Muriicola sp. Z0-33]